MRSGSKTLQVPLAKGVDNSFLRRRRLNRNSFRAHLYASPPSDKYVLHDEAIEIDTIEAASTSVSLLSSDDDEDDDFVDFECDTVVLW